MIVHVLKDGTVLEDIKGHVVKKEDAEIAYQIMRTVHEEIKRKRKEKENGHQV